MTVTLNFGSRKREAEHFIKEISQYPGVAVTTDREKDFIVHLHAVNIVGTEVIRRAERQFNH